MPELQDFVSMGPVGGDFNINLYYEPDSIYGIPALMPTPGYTLAATPPSGYTTQQVRGMLEHKGVLYCVIGARLYSLVGTTFTYLGSSALDSTSGRVWMAVNANDHIVMVDGSTPKIYTYIVGGAYAEFNHLAGATLVPLTVTYQDTFMIVAMKDTRRLYCSAIDNADAQGDWITTNMASKEGGPDYNMGAISCGSDLWVFGKQTTESWYYSAASSGFPFARTRQGLLPVGCVATNSICVLDNSVFWLNDKCEVCRTAGYGFLVISPPQLNDTLQGYAKNGLGYVSDAVAFPVYWEGHPWYVLHFPNMQRTWVYDVAAAAAGQKGWFLWQSGHGISNRHRSCCSAFFAGKWRLGDYATSSSIWNLDDDVYTDYGNDRIYTKYGKYLSVDQKRVVFNSFSLRQKHSPISALSNPKNGTTTSLNGSHDTGATTLTVVSSTGFAVNDIARIQLNTMAYDYKKITSVPGGGTTLVIESGLSSPADSGRQVACLDRYAVYPQITLSANNGYSGVKTTTTAGGVPESTVDALKWSGLGSGYDTLFTVKYEGGGLFAILGASVEVKAANH